MDKIKNSIIFFIVAIIILLIITLVALINLKKRNTHHIPNSENEIDTQGDIGEVFEVTNEEVNVDNMSKVKTVEAIILTILLPIKIDESNLS